MTDAVRADLTLFHRFQQRRLSLGRGAVDFVGQNDVGEQRAWLKNEAFAGPLKDADADKVGGQQVRSELHALPRAIDRRCERLGQTGLANAWHVFDEQVTFGQQAHDRQFDCITLAVDD